MSAAATLHWFYWEHLNYKLVTDGGCGASAHCRNQRVPGCSVLGGYNWTSQWFDADLNTLYDHWERWQQGYVLLWESTRGQGKEQRQVFSTSTKRYVLQSQMVNHSEKCVIRSLMEVPTRVMLMLFCCTSVLQLKDRLLQDLTNQNHKWKLSEAR